MSENGVNIGHEDNNGTGEEQIQLKEEDLSQVHNVYCDKIKATIRNLTFFSTLFRSLPLRLRWPLPWIWPSSVRVTLTTTSSIPASSISPRYPHIRRAETRSRGEQKGPHTMTDISNVHVFFQALLCPDDWRGPPPGRGEDVASLRDLHLHQPKVPLLQDGSKVLAECHQVMQTWICVTAASCDHPVHSHCPQTQSHAQPGIQKGPSTKQRGKGKLLENRGRSRETGTNETQGCQFEATGYSHWTSYVSDFQAVDPQPPLQAGQVRSRDRPPDRVPSACAQKEKVRSGSATNSRRGECGHVMHFLPLKLHSQA